MGIYLTGNCVRILTYHNVTFCTSNFRGTHRRGIHINVAYSFDLRGTKLITYFLLLPDWMVEKSYPEHSFSPKNTDVLTTGQVLRSTHKKTKELLNRRLRKRQLLQIKVNNEMTTKRSSQECEEVEYWKKFLTVELLEFPQLNPASFWTSSIPQTDLF